VNFATLREAKRAAMRAVNPVVGQGHTVKFSVFEIRVNPADLPSLKDDEWLTQSPVDWEQERIPIPLGMTLIPDAAQPAGSAAGRAVYEIIPWDPA
jgi:hypothetical protein